MKRNKIEKKNILFDGKLYTTKWSRKKIQSVCESCAVFVVDKSIVAIKGNFQRINK